LAAELQVAVARLPADAATGQPAEPTFFEITTAMAFLHFARQQVDAAVLEVGLGGRLDSTNVCRPSVCIITSISFDHTRQLGNTLAAIAGEKAGIIKPGVPVISGVVNEEPREVIRHVAHESGARLFQCGEDFDFDDSSGSSTRGEGGERLDYREPAADPVWTLADVQVGLLGRHQAANAAAAIAAVRRLQEQGWPIGETALRQGLAAVRWPARIEVVGRRPTVILDVAHNVASIAALLAVLGERFAGRRRILIFASSKDKDTAGMLRLLLPAFDEVVLTRYIRNPRAVELEVLYDLALSQIPAGNHGQRSPAVHTAATPEQAWHLARQAAGPDDLVCIAGSFFLAAELRPLAGAATLESCAIGS
jgi:dihydrofolate synthase/folylpolyglutamate synthase